MQTSWRMYKVFDAIKKKQNDFLLSFVCFGRDWPKILRGMGKWKWRWKKNLMRLMQRRGSQVLDRYGLIVNKCDSFDSLFLCWKWWKRNPSSQTLAWKAFWVYWFIFLAILLFFLDNILRIRWRQGQKKGDGGSIANNSTFLGHSLFTRAVPDGPRFKPKVQRFQCLCFGGFYFESQTTSGILSDWLWIIKRAGQQISIVNVQELRGVNCSSLFLSLSQPDERSGYEQAILRRWRGSKSTHELWQ